MNAISRRINNRESNEVKDTDSRIIDFQRNLTVRVERDYANGVLTRKEYTQCMNDISTKVREHTRQLRNDNHDRYGTSK